MGLEKKKKANETSFKKKHTNETTEKHHTGRRSVSRDRGSLGHILAPSPTGGTRAWHPCMARLPSPAGGGTRSDAPPWASDFVAESHLILLGHHPTSPPHHMAGKKALSVTRHTLPRPLNSEEIIKTVKSVCVASAGEMAPGPQRILPHVRTGSPGGQPAPGVGGSCLPLSPFLLSAQPKAAAHTLKFPLKAMNQSCPTAAGPAAHPWLLTAQLSTAGPSTCTAPIYSPR